MFKKFFELFYRLALYSNQLHIHLRSQKNVIKIKTPDLRSDRSPSCMGHLFVNKDTALPGVKQNIYILL